MKASKANTDIEVELNVANGDGTLPEYVLPDRQHADPNVVECFVPVKPGDGPITVFGRFSGSILVGSIDLIADGNFTSSSHIEPAHNQDKVKYYNRRPINFKKTLTNPNPAGWPPKVYEGKMKVKALEEDPEMMEGYEMPDIQGRQAGVGSITVVFNFSQSQIGRYSHTYQSCVFGNRDKDNPRFIYDCGIPSDHELEHVMTDENPVEQKRSVKFRNHFNEERVGFKPFCKVVFYYRSQQAIDAAGCELRPMEKYHDLAPGDLTQFDLGTKSPGVISHDINDSAAAMALSNNAQDILASPPTAAHVNQVTQGQSQGVVESMEQPQEPRPKLLGQVLNLSGERKKLGGTLNLSKIDKEKSPIVTDFRKAKSRSPGLKGDIDEAYERASEQRDVGVGPVEESTLTPENDQGQDEKYFKDLFEEDERDQQKIGQPEKDDWASRENIPFEHADHQDGIGADKDMEDVSSANAFGGNSTWDFQVLDPIATQPEDTTPMDHEAEAQEETTHQSETNQEATPTTHGNWGFQVSDPNPSQPGDTIPADYQAEGQDKIIPQPEAAEEGAPAVQTESLDRSSNDFASTTDFDQMPSIDAIRAVVTKEGVEQDVILQVLHRNGPYRDHEKAIVEFGRRVQEIIAQDEVTGRYFLIEDLSHHRTQEAPTGQYQDSLPQQDSLPHPDSLRHHDPLSQQDSLPHQNALPRQDSLSHQDSEMVDAGTPNYSSNQKVQSIKQEQIDLTSDAPSFPYPTPPPRKATSTTTGTPASNSKSKKRRATSSALAEDSPARLRKERALKELEETHAKLAALKKDNELKKKAAEEKAAKDAEEKLRKQKEKEEKRKAKRAEKERKAKEAEAEALAEALQREADLKLAQDELLAAQVEAEQEVAISQDPNEIEQSSDSGVDSDDESDEAGSDAGVVKMETEE